MRRGFHAIRCHEWQLICDTEIFKLLNATNRTQAARASFEAE
jgi:hypothetical protein